MFFGFRASGLHGEQRGTNLLDGGAPFYDTYETKDGKHVAVGALEPQFYAELLQKLGIDGGELPAQMDRAQWPALKARFAGVFKQKTRAEWCALLEGSDACFAPVLTLAEAPAHRHAAARGGFVDVGGITQAAPSPRFSRSTPEAPRPAVEPGANTSQVLAQAGFSADEIAALRAAGVVVGE